MEHFHKDNSENKELDLNQSILDFMNQNATCDTDSTNDNEDHINDNINKLFNPKSN